MKARTRNGSSHKATNSRATKNNDRAKPPTAPSEIQRWEGEGGSPPSKGKRRDDRPAQITGILARLLARLPRSRRH